MFYLGKINSYKPIVSDVSDDDLVETVKQIEKSEKVIAPTPGLTRTTPFDIFKTTRGRRSCSTRKSVKSPHIYQFYPQTCIPTHELLTKPRQPAVTLQNSKTCPLHRAALDTNSKESMHCGQWEPYRILPLFLNISLKSLLLFHDQLVLISLHHIWVKIASNYVNLFLKLEYFPYILTCIFVLFVWIIVSSLHNSS